MSIVRAAAAKGYELAKRSPMLVRLAQTPLLGAFKAQVSAWLKPEDSDYERWMANRVAQRIRSYPYSREPGLLSFITPVWNTPVSFLHDLTTSLKRQKGRQSFEWVVLDNGSTDVETRSYLKKVVGKLRWTRLCRTEENLGIIAGMRFCLEQATGRYVLPVDHDDQLYRDCVAVVTSCIQRHNHPPLMYSDEDHLLDGKYIYPYFKPDWDPVLFLNSAYIAHQGVIDRKLALELDVYGNARTNGSPDWDAFMRFLLAGHAPVHIPEMLYSWRMHPQSTSGNIDSKTYIHESHRAVLEGFLSQRPHADRYHLELSPLFNGTPDWWVRRRHVDPRPLRSIVLTDAGPPYHAAQVGSSCDYPLHRVARIRCDAGVETLREPVLQAAREEGLVCLVSDRVEIQNREWPWEVLALMELHPDTAVVGGRIVNRQQIVVDAGRYLGFGSGCDCPDRTRSVSDPGYQAQMWKQRSVSAVSSQFCVFDAKFLLALIDSGFCRGASLPYLGAWAGAFALRKNRRVVYSPFLSGATDEEWESRVSDTERRAFLNANRDILPDTRFYPACFGLDMAHRYEPVLPIERERAIASLRDGTNETATDGSACGPNVLRIPA